MKEDDFEGMLARSRDLAARGEWLAALEALDQAAGLYPERAEVWYNKGKILNRIERFEAALEAFEMMTSLDPLNADAWYQKGVMLMKLGRTKPALDAFHEAQRLSPEGADGGGAGVDFLAILNREASAIEGVVRREADVYVSETYRFRLALVFEWIDGSSEWLTAVEAAPGRVEVSSSCYPNCRAVLEARERIPCHYPAKDLVRDLADGVMARVGEPQYYVFPKGLLPACSLRMQDREGVEILIDIIVTDRFAYQLTVEVAENAREQRYFATRLPLNFNPY